MPPAVLPGHELRHRQPDEGRGVPEAVQAFNVMHGFGEGAGLEFPGPHPV